MAQSQKKLTFSTPKGVAIYPWLNKPDTAFDANGKYKVSLRIAAADAKPLMDSIKAASDSHFGDKAAQAKMPFKTDDETGDVIFTTKSNYQPKFMDSTGAAISENNVPQIYGGSTLKAAGTMFQYNAGGSIGVSLQLAGIQIVELANATNDGVHFEPVKDGFVAANDNNEESAAYNF